MQYVTASKNGPHRQSSFVFGSHPAREAASFQQSDYSSVSNFQLILPHHAELHTGHLPTEATFTPTGGPPGLGGAATGDATASAATLASIASEMEILMALENLIG